jgi:hypothetical protein
LIIVGCDFSHIPLFLFADVVVDQTKREEEEVCIIVDTHDQKSIERPRYICSTYYYDREIDVMIIFILDDD